MRRLPPLDIMAPETEAAPLPVAPTHPRSTNGVHPKTSIPAAPTNGSGARAGILRGSFADAIAIITEPEGKGEGYRHGWLGNTGTGKTTAIARLIAESDNNALTIIHDDSKRNPQYRSVVVRDFSEAPDDATTVTVRGDPMSGLLVEPEQLGELCVRIGMAGLPVRFVIDELDRACSPGGRELIGTNVRTCLVRGRALTLSVLWSTQAPQRAPREFVDQSTTIALCQLGPRALNYLGDRLLFDDELLGVVPTLRIGEFALYQQGRNWNRTIYY